MTVISLPALRRRLTERQRALKRLQRKAQGDRDAEELKACKEAVALLQQEIGAREDAARPKATPVFATGPGAPSPVAVTRVSPSGRPTELLEAESPEAAVCWDGRAWRRLPGA